MLASLPAVWRNRRGMLSIWGYTFHNWELLGLWAWLPAFLTAALVFHGHENPAALALMFAGLTYVANIAGSIIGGTMADRWGRVQTILLWSCVSLALSFSIGWLMVSSPLPFWWRSPASTTSPASPIPRPTRWSSPRACRRTLSAAPFRCAR